MSKFFLIISAFALIVSVTVCATHVAHANDDNTTEISISVDADSPNDNTLGSNGCDLSCGGCCVHHAMNTTHTAKAILSYNKNKMSLPDTNLFVSHFIYGLKRPPKS